MAGESLGNFHSFWYPVGYMMLVIPSVTVRFPAKNDALTFVLPNVDSTSQQRRMPSGIAFAVRCPWARLMFSVCTSTEFSIGEMVRRVSFTRWDEIVC